MADAFLLADFAPKAYAHLLRKSLSLAFIDYFICSALPPNGIIMLWAASRDEHNDTSSIILCTSCALHTRQILRSISLDFLRLFERFRWIFSKLRGL